MAQNKHKTKRRIICILCASIIALYALAIPIGAVVESSQGGYLDFNLTATSSFPLTVGFSYVTRDTSTGAGNTYVYATEIGGFGEEWNTTLYGADSYTQNYTPMEGLEYELQGSLEYNFLERDFPTENNIEWDDGNFHSVIRRGYQTISFQNKAPSGGNILGQQQGVVLRARDVVYNPAWLMTTEDGTSQTDEAMLPQFLSPTVENSSNEAVVLTYSWSCTIIDQEGVEHTHSDFEVFDTRVSNSSIYVPIIPIDVLEQYKTQKTIVIADYKGFLDVDYYEYTEPELDIVGTWEFNETVSALSYSEDTLLMWTTVNGNSISMEFCKWVNSSGETFGVAFVGDYSPDDDYYIGIYYNATKDNVRYASTSGGYKSIEFADMKQLIINDNFDYTNGYYYSEDFYTWLKANAIKQGSTSTVAEEGTWAQVEKSGDGYLLRLQYPLYDTSGVTITDTETYRNNMSYYGFPTFEKYIDTDSTIIKPSLPYEADFTGWLGTAVGGFLDFELFDGFSLGGLLSVLIGFSFIMLFLKFFAGG